MATLSLPDFTGLRNAAAVTKTKNAVAQKEGQALNDAGFKVALGRYMQRCVEDFNIQAALDAGGEPKPTTADFGSEIGVAAE
jgi:hypothetical protein